MPLASREDGGTMSRTMAVTERMTADEYLRLPEDECPPRTELIAGELVVHQPLPRHQFIRDDLHVALALWTRATAGRGRVVSPLDVKLDDHNVYAPDLLWYSQSRVPARGGGRPSPLPDLAVELRSPSTWRYDIGT